MFSLFCVFSLSMVSCCCHSLSANQWNRNVNLTPAGVYWLFFDTMLESVIDTRGVCGTCARSYSLFIALKTPLYDLGGFHCLLFFDSFSCWNSVFRFLFFFYAARLSTAINMKKKLLLMKWANRVNQRKCLDKYLFIWYNFWRKCYRCWLGELKWGAPWKRISVSENGPKNLLM